MSMERLLQTDCIKEAETLAAVGGGAKRPRNLAFRRLVC